jgi:hypothetical protein
MPNRALVRRRRHSAMNGDRDPKVDRLNGDDKTGTGRDGSRVCRESRYYETEPISYRGVCENVFLCAQCLRYVSTRSQRVANAKWPEPNFIRPVPAGMGLVQLISLHERMTASGYPPHVLLLKPSVVPEQETTVELPELPQKNVVPLVYPYAGAEIRFDSRRWVVPVSRDVFKCDSSFLNFFCFFFFFLTKRLC